MRNWGKSSTFAAKINSNGGYSNLHYRKYITKNKRVMNFFDRKNEQKTLLSIKEQSVQDCSRMTVITGRRRIGKTMLIRHTFSEDELIYLFVARKSEIELVESYIAIIREKGLYIPDGLQRFSQLMRHLFELGKTQALTIAIDEFQEFDNINPSVFSDMQNLWDNYKEQTHLNLVISGSAYRLMQKIFMDKDEPLFNRADAIIRLQPFSIATQKQILATYSPNYTSDDLLAMYAITGGVPKYLAWLFDNGCKTKDEMYAAVFSENSHFIEEGRTLLVSEFGKNYGIYFSILQEIAMGNTTQAQIEAKLGGISIGGYLKQLENTYSLIRRVRPLFAKKESKTVRFAIRDQFLHFWFHHIEKNRSLVEIQNFEGLLMLAMNSYTTYSGLVLEDYFRRKLAETGEWREIGCWWQAKAIEYHSQQIDAELDIVALPLMGRGALVAEVKRKREEYEHELFMTKVQYLKQKHLHTYSIETKLFTLTEM